MMMLVWLALALALAIPVEDVTLPNGLRVVVSVDRAAEATEIAMSPDRSIVVVVGNVDPEAVRASYAGWARPSPAPSPLPVPVVEGELWQVAEGAPSLTVEWAAPADELSPLVPALLGGTPERRGTVLRWTPESGWPPAQRRALDALLERWVRPSPREVQSAREACTNWAAAPNAQVRARKLLAVTLATGNPRLFRELPDRCARLDATALSSLARALGRRGRRVRMVTQRDAP
jgi:hypothetical protein